MNDKDLRALAAKLLKHYVVEDEAVAKIVETKAPERGEPKVIPMITAEERALLNMLGGPMAGVMEGRVISLAAQGCGCGCGCGCGDGDGDGVGGGEGAAGAGAAGAGEGDAGEASASADASAADAAAAAAGATGDLGAAAADAAEASAAATGVAGDLGAAADAAAAAEASAAAAGATGAAAGEAAGTGLSAGEAAGWGGLGAGLGSQGAEGLAGLADGPDGPESGLVGLTNDSLSMMSPAELSALMSAPQADRGISAATYSSLADQNAALSDTLGAVNAGLDANAAAQGSSGALGSLGSALGELLGVSSAQAAPAGPATSGVADVLDAANAAAQQGQLSEFLSSNPTAASVLGNYAAEFANLQATNNAMLGAQGQQGIYGSQPGLALDQNANVYGSLVGPSSAVAAAPSSPYGTLSMSPEQAQQAELAGQIGMIGASPSATAFTAAPAAPEAPAAPAAPSQVAAAPSLAPEAPTTSLTVQGPAPTAMSSTSTQAQAPSYTGIDAIDSRIANALNNPGTTALNIAVGAVPGLGIANTLSGLLGGPTVGSALAGLASGATGQASSSAGTDMGGSGDAGTPRPIPPSASDTIDLATFDPTSLPSATSPVDTASAALRRYLGPASDPYRYGMGPERAYYSAEGGYFNADQYFANGGLVSPTQPPSQPTVPPYPTMAFTDGGGPVGSIAQPPGLAASDAYGSDAPHASPMAPSIAASVPTMQPGLTTLAMKNVNASPAPSPISQNPNVGYALGQSPLSNL